MSEALVAPREGSVDRNWERLAQRLNQSKSLPARGAWIEITIFAEVVSFPMVAPREGSVDRNHNFCSGIRFAKSSLPARGAWIEIVGE